MEGVQEGAQQSDDFKGWILVILRLAILLSIGIIVATALIGKHFINKAEGDYNENRSREGLRNIVRFNCSTALNIASDECNLLCANIFDKVDDHDIPQTCTSFYLYQGIYEIVFIPKCVNLFTGLGLPEVDKRPLDKYADYNTGMNIYTIMLPMFC
jgi:hypothetical protein